MHLTPPYLQPARGAAVAFAALALTAASAAAQSQAAPDSSAVAIPVDAAPAPVPRHVSAWVAVSPSVPMKSPGPLVHGSLVAVGASMSWTLQQGAFTAMRYRVDLMPVMLFSDVAVGRPARCGAEECVFHALDRDQVYAAGVLPFGLELGTPAAWRAGLGVTASGGLVVSRRPIPYPTTGSLNFLATAGISAHLRLAERVALTAGVQRAHISNGRMKPDNPGIDYTSWQLGLRY